MQLIEINMIVSFNDQMLGCYEFQAIVSANLLYCITTDQTLHILDGFVFVVLSL